MCLQVNVVSKLLSTGIIERSCLFRHIFNYGGDRHHYAQCGG